MPGREGAKVAPERYRKSTAMRAWFSTGAPPPHEEVLLTPVTSTLHIEVLAPIAFAVSRRTLQSSQAGTHARRPGLQ